MRLALFADIHGNSIALDAVLDNVRALGGVDEYWVLGDLAAVGHDPLGTLERLAALPNARFVRGNTDRYLVTDELPRPSLEAVANDPALLPTLVEIAGGFGWTKGALASNGWLAWLGKLPLEQRTTLPDGTRLLGVHASVAGGDGGRSVSPRLAAGELSALMQGADAELVCVAHAHWPLDVNLGSLRVVNVGSVSNSFQPDLRASYALVDATPDGYTVDLRRVDYDRDAVVAALRHTGHPARRFISEHMLGLQAPHWARAPVNGTGPAAPPAGGIL